MSFEYEEMQRNQQRLWNMASLWRRKPEVGVTPADVVHEENKWKLLRYRRPAGVPVQHRTPILMIPSLINRHYVLDLAPGRSFVEYLLKRGHDVFIIDWGTPGDEDRYLEFADFAYRYIRRAVRVASGYGESKQVHLLGYCLGGTLTTIFTSLEQERVASLLALAAPIRFEGAGTLAEWTRVPSFNVKALAEGMGNMPWPLMQFAFSMLRPTLNLKKLVNLIDRAWSDEFLDGFLATETWGSDNVSFPGRAWAEYCQWLYRDDALVNDTLTIDGKPARLENITCPTLVVCFGHDTIVPAENANVLLERVSSKDKEIIEQPGGHVGAVVSRKAAQGLWPAMAEWWEARDGKKKTKPKVAVAR